MDSINQWIASKYDAEIKEYVDSVYIPGDFSAAIVQAGDWGGESNSSIYPNQYNWLESRVNILAGSIVKATYTEETGYSLLFNNCGDVAMRLIKAGVLADGRSVAEAVSLREKFYELHGIRLLPDFWEDLLKEIFEQEGGAFG